jgi:uncharacterized protein (TIGR03663 family)
MLESPPKQSWFDRPFFEALPFLNGETLLFSLILILVMISRLYDLGLRTLSHDESLHAFFSWLFAQGQGYQHNPMMHGPLQFHLIALSDFFFGDSVFTARLPAALASILTVAMVWKWRRYLGRVGALVAATMMLISPILLYYGRYAREDALAGLAGLMSLYAILRYLETGKSRFLFLLTGATALHFITKETSFIYTAQALLFLAVLLTARITRAPWKDSSLYNGFVIALVIGLIMLGLAGGLTLFTHAQAPLNPGQTAAPLNPSQTPGALGGIGSNSLTSLTLVGIAVLALLVAAGVALIGYGWKNLRAERSFDLLILLGTLVLPQLSALPVSLVGWNPLDYTFYWPGWNLQALLSQGPVRVAVFLIPFLAISVAIGLLWDRKTWLLNAALFYAIFIVFYTSVFSNWQGFFTGIVGSLGYWLSQQGVHRGDQPWYYYLLIQIPIYEFLPALGAILAAFLGIRRQSPPPASSSGEAAGQSVETQAGGNYTFALLLWWSLSSLLAFTLAGEKMPWLTYHIALPMILLSGWALGRVIERVDWRAVAQPRGLLAGLLVLIFLIGLASALGAGLGANPPFQGKTSAQLTATAAFLLPFSVAVGSAIGLVFLLAEGEFANFLRVTCLVFFALLAILTGRAAYRAAFINYDDATEFLVYAHGANGVTDVMQQIDLISRKTVGGTDLVVAYDASGTNQGVSWPFKFYLRDYTNAVAFSEPTIDLRNDPVIIVSPNNFQAIQPIVANQYYQFNYTRMVWPNQDYFGLTGPRLWAALTNPSMRGALLQIWLNRDFQLYGQATGETSVTVSNWSPSDRMEFFVRKDIAAQVWQYGIAQTISSQTDPYKQGAITLQADVLIAPGPQAKGQMNDPHGIAVAPDGSLYVADTNDNMIQHFSSSGQFISDWGSYGDSSVTPAKLGTFNQPWGVAVSPDGKWVYVTDTWNHRIQKFSADGTPISSWGKGVYGDMNDPFGLWGPRGIAVDSRGRVFVTDTGNKRVLVYDADGKFITQFGQVGMQPGQFDEPVGLALDSQGNVYVADTWNQRIQVFAPNADGTVYSPLRQWDISGWYGQSLENKPFLAINAQDDVFVSDPEGYRVLEFSSDGSFIHTWGDYGTDLATFGLASAVAVDNQGHVWVSDGANNRILRFTLP